MTDQYPSPNPPPAPPAKGQHGPRPQGPADVDLAWREPPLVTSPGVPRVWNGQEWVPAPHLSPDGKAWWDGVSWVAVTSHRHRVWGTIAIVLAVLTLGYCTPMTLIGIADSRVRPDYNPGLSEALIPLVLAGPAYLFAVISIVLDLREKRRPRRGWLSLAIAGASTLFLWFAIFAGTR